MSGPGGSVPETGFTDGAGERCVKVLPQTEHSKGSSPVWVAVCLTIPALSWKEGVFFRLYLLPQSEQLNGLLPRLCRCRSPYPPELMAVFPVLLVFYCSAEGLNLTEVHRFASSQLLISGSECDVLW